MAGKISVRVLLYRSKTLANGEHPLMLCLTKNRQRIYKSIQLSCSNKTWDEDKGKPRKNHPYKSEIEASITRVTQKYLDKVMEFMAMGKDISLDELMNQVERPTRLITVREYFEQHISKLKKADQIGNSKAYASTIKMFMYYTNQKDIYLSELSVKHLEQFEQYLRERGNKEVSMLSYFKTLKAIVNKAADEKIISKDSSPFNEFKTSKFNTKTKKRAIRKEDIQAIAALNIPPADTFLIEAKNFFLFSYLGQGMNFHDVAKLQWKNIENGRVYYVRSKTKKQMHFQIAPLAQQILDYYKTFTGGHPDNYIFTFLKSNSGGTEEQKYNKIMSQLAKMNQGLKKLGEMAGLEIILTTYVARHSYATVLKQMNIPASVIKEGMGHSTELITNIYLKEFGNDVIDRANESLL